MNLRLKLLCLGLCLISLIFPVVASAIGFGVTSGLDYQNRNFDRSEMEYDLDYWGLFIQPTLNLSQHWSIFVRLAYSRVVFDRPEFGSTDYDQWGLEWGAGSSFTIFRWSGLYSVLEGRFSRADTRRGPQEGAREEGDLLLWNAELRAGWDFKVISAFLGGAYTDGRIYHSYSSETKSFSDTYELKDTWKTFVGGQVNLPPVTSLQGRYYFGKNILAVLSVGINF